MRNRVLACAAAGLVGLLLMAAHAAAQPVPRTLDGKPDLTGVYQPGSSVAGTWAEANQGRGVGGGGNARQGANPPYQPWAHERVWQAWKRFNIDNPVARCIPQLDLGTGGLYPVQFIQTPQAIVILLESRHNWRYIPLNVPHNPDLDPSWMGASVGRWEGNTLVVDITNFKERLVGSEIRSPRPAHSRTFHARRLQHHRLRSQSGRFQSADQALHDYEQIHVAAWHRFAGIRVRRQRGPRTL